MMACDHDVHLLEAGRQAHTAQFEAQTGQRAEACAAARRAIVHLIEWYDAELDHKQASPPARQ
jgi:hypothetical protein